MLYKHESVTRDVERKRDTCSNMEALRRVHPYVQKKPQSPSKHAKHCGHLTVTPKHEALTPQFQIFPRDLQPHVQSFFHWNNLLCRYLPSFSLPPFLHPLLRSHLASYHIE